MEDYYGYMAVRNVKFPGDPGDPKSWPTAGVTLMAAFNKWRKSARVSALTEELLRLLGVPARQAQRIIRLPLPERSAGEVLQLTPPALVADLEIELAVLAKENLPAIVIGAHGLVCVGLKRSQHDDVLVER